ncbi:hypothetical protein MBUL_01283 [Methylobacterium bullatum]|uniref:Intracellular proteinase inhibitor BsuPI domain-containing protein n=1 Tax=Methylobacterium bullatum TaxID=570505 RepID=A0A679IRZ5_9HYPH|nr:hypothetical protein MBUL_01283 [Methylobacterium bullatum]
MALLPVAAHAADRTVTITGGQVSAPVGLIVQVKSITLGEDDTTVRLLASFDSHRTTFVNMNDRQNAYLAWGDGAEQRLHLRQIADNKWMRVVNGRTMEGDLVFPGALPPDATRLTLVFNPGRSGEDTSAPGITVPLVLTP